MMKKVLVTGGAGFIGFHVAQALLEKGDFVVIVDNFNNYYNPKLKYARIKELKKSKNKKNLKVYRSDISNYKKLEKIFRKNKFDKICHLAAQAGVRYSLKNPFIYEKSNNLGTLNLLELARKFQIKDFIFASSSSVYGGNDKIPFSEDDKVDNPISLYAATKKSNELYAHVYHHLYGINCIGLRFFTVYGPWGRPDMGCFKFVKNIIEGNPIEVYNQGNMKRDFTYVGDIVKGILSALDKSLGYEIINLGNNTPIELNKFIGVIEDIVGKKAKKKLMGMQPGDVPVTYANIDKAKKLLGYKPLINVEEGLKNFVEWYKKYNNIK
jgi:UDP-glucuronate 4-epimerase